MRPVVFLHIPKTAGQTVHHALAAMVGAANVSPVRVNDLAVDGRKMPPGYLLHSGHIDWTELDSVGPDPFVFTVLRDPAERIASFYFYMLNKAQTATQDDLARPGNAGLRWIASISADEYFLGGPPNWQRFVRNLYFNFYCSYLATRKMNGRVDLAGLEPPEIIARAVDGAKALSRIYHVDRLDLLEQDIARIYGKQIEVSGRYNNAGVHTRDELRWPKLVARFERDDSAQKVERFVAHDRRLLKQLVFAA